MIKELNEIAKVEEVNAVIMATAASTHYVIAKMMLKNRKHMSVEKPSTTNYREAEELSKILK